MQMLAISEKLEQNDPQIVEKDASGTVTSTKQFVWNGMAVSEERDASNNVTKRFYGQGEQMVVSGTATNYYFTRDHLGSIREMTDSSGTVHASYSYDPYGRSTKVSGDLEIDFGFTGHYRHLPSCLLLAPYRAYSPDLGRWISRDPIAEKGGLNLYDYVFNDPVNGVDSLGLFRLGQFLKGVAELSGGLAVAIAGMGAEAPTGGLATFVVIDSLVVASHGLANIGDSFNRNNNSKPDFIENGPSNIPAVIGYAADGETGQKYGNILDFSIDLTNDLDTLGDATTNEAFVEGGLTLGNDLFSYFFGENPRENKDGCDKL